MTKLFLGATHLVAVDVRSEKYEIARKAELPIVTVEWVKVKPPLI